MSSSNNKPSPSDQNFERLSGSKLSRPDFNSRKTSDRLREGAVFEKRPFRVMVSGGNIRKGRRSVFKETGLDEGEDENDGAKGMREEVAREEQEEGRRRHNPLYTNDDEEAFGAITGLRSERQNGKRRSEQMPRRGSSLDNDGEGEEENKKNKRDHRRRSSTGQARLQRRREHDPNRPWYQKLYKAEGRPQVQTAAGPPPAVPALSRFTMLVLLIALVLPSFSYYTTVQGKKAGGVAEASPLVPVQQVKREESSSPTEACRRFAHQAARVNGSLYIYGGQALKEAGQVEGNWNNYLLELDLTKEWDVDDPALKGLEIPDGPPAVSMGYLWNDFHSLFLYGGSFSDSPYVDPAPESIWEYTIASREWNEWKDPKTSKGNFSTQADQPVKRAAEGAGVSIPELGFSYYFGGHQDWATTPGWSTHTDRIYLQSLLEFTHPNWINDGITSFSPPQGAGERGAFRNITEGGVQKDYFPERADGVLVYVPGWGEKGVLIGLAGGIQEEDRFTHDLEVLDVYDIARSEWFHQNTTGEAPSVRVNPCAVVAGARDGSSFQVYLFGGQNLQPYKEQIQYDDMYILSIPAFTWIKVDQPKSHKASARAGHTCTLRDRQMIVVGGYIGNENTCDSPGVYVFDTTTLQWKDKFEPGDHEPDFSPLDSVRAGSYGYSVPKPVVEAIGGDEEGGAKVSKPSISATGGPFSTGRAPIYTITNAGATATITSSPDSTGDSSPDDNDDDDDDEDGDDAHKPPQAGLIAAGVTAGLLGLLAAYLGFCAWVYRRTIRSYRHHIAISNRYGASPGPDTVALFPGAATNKPRSSRGRWGGDDNMSEEHSSFAWVGQGSSDEPSWLTEPKFVSSEDASPGTLRGSGSARGGSWRGGGEERGSGEGRARMSEDSGSGDSLLEGQEPSFFSVVMGPRRALRVVNGGD